MISNIELANKRREQHRRLQEDEKKAQLVIHLEQESEGATSKLNVINSRWPEMAEITDPMDLNDRLHYQRDRIMNLMSQKDGIISELQDALNQADKVYNSDEIKHQGDIQSLIERIDEQIDVMKMVYLEHLELLHQSIDSERRTFKSFHSQKWQELYDQRREEGEKNLNDLLEQKEKYFEEITATRLQHEEMNRNRRIELDRDNDLMQQKLQRVKAEIDLNAEQLNYNYYILQKRAAENFIVRSKQKNRLIKMRTYISTLRKRIHDSKTIQAMDIDRQTKYVLNLYTNIKELESKSNAFSENDDRKVCKSRVRANRRYS